MPTRERRASRDEVLDLKAAGEVVNLAPEYLRKLKYGDRPPPLFTHRGRLYVRRGELEEWIADYRRIPS